MGTGRSGKSGGKRGGGRSTTIAARVSDTVAVATKRVKEATAADVQSAVSDLIKKATGPKGNPSVKGKTVDFTNPKTGDSMSANLSNTRQAYTVVDQATGKRNKKYKYGYLVRVDNKTKNTSATRTVDTLRDVRSFIYSHGGVQ